MKISCATLTYARVPMLEEAIESFLRQDYGDKEMVIYNTYEKQHLTFTHPLVHVVNVYSRPSTLGETRNRCIQMCKGDFILNLDDDDVILPGYLSWLAKNLEGRDWVRQDKRFALRAGKIGWIAEQANNQTLFRRSTWNGLGGFPQVNSGEDAGFKKLLMEKSVGAKVACSNSEIGFLYRWHGQNISKNGRDQPGAMSGLQHQSRLVMKDPPRRGKVILHPRWHHDYTKLASDWVAKNP